MLIVSLQQGEEYIEEEKTEPAETHFKPEPYQQEQPSDDQNQITVEVIDKENLPNQDSSDMIFMIGVGWQEDGEWKYKNFISKKTHFAP